MSRRKNRMARRLPLVRQSLPECGMAIARCGNCGPPRSPKSGTYVGHHFPVGHPNSGVICGRAGWTKSAGIWLKEERRKSLSDWTENFPNSHSEGGTGKKSPDSRSGPFLKNSSGAIQRVTQECARWGSSSVGIGGYFMTEQDQDAVVGRILRQYKEQNDLAVKLEEAKG